MDVTVLGSGVIGLTSAIRLQEAGHRVRVVAGAPPSETTSALAAAVWFPTHAGPPDRVRAWSAATFTELARQAAAGVPGVVMRESLNLHREPPGEPDWVAAVGDVRAARPDELPPGYPHGLRYAVPLAEMPRYLPWLAGRFRAGGGETQLRRVAALDELPGDVLVHCSGLGARELAGDASVHPVRGQVVRVGNPGLTMSVRDEHHPGGRAYVHPRDTDVILGGTLDEHAWDTRPDPDVTAAILARCLDIVPALRDARVLGSWAGLRPARPQVRLAVESLSDGRRVVHDYGHGGSGVTLCWGCADEVVALVAGGS